MRGTRVRAGLTAVLTGVLVVLMTLGVGAGVGAASGRPPGPVPGPEAGAPVAPVVARAGGGLAVPPGFDERAGYVPAVEQLGGGPRLTRPDGGCSSPWGGTRYGFDGACRSHDLGYDLLRDAAATGRPYAGTARARVDAQMWRDMAAVCGPDLACLGVAAVYGGVVTLNSTSEAFSVPAPRSLHRVLVPVGGAVAVLAGWVLLARQRRWVCAVPVPLVLGVAAATASWQPSMLPRSPGAQLLVTGLSTLSGVVLGAVAGRAWSAVATSPLRWRVGPVAAALVAAALLVGATAGHAGQVQQAVPMGVVPLTLWQSLLAGLVGAGLAVVAALVPAAVVRGVRYARRTRPARGSTPRQAWLVGAVVLLLLPGLTARPEEAAAAPVLDGQHQFLHGGQDADRIALVAGRPALTPLRLAVPVTQGDARTRADEAVRRLVAAGGLDRRVVLVALPTGSGWVNPAAVDAVELLAAGDAATVTVQYDDRPSYRSFLSGGGARAAEQATALLDALARALAATRRATGPWVVVYGESLGAVGGLRVQDHPAVDATVWVGVPHAARGLVERGQALVEHADDPVTAWSPRLVVAPTDRWRAGWVPVVSFWAGTADLVASLDQPAGHGHRYGAELVPALGTALGPAVPTTQDRDRLVAVGAAVEAAVTGGG